MKSKNNILNKGFTLIEMIVALALFTIVITIATGALLSLIGGSSSAQGEQSVMTTMTFALDSMTREIRTGTSYFGTTVANLSSQATWDKTIIGDSPSGSAAVSFMESGSSITTGASLNNRIAYYYDSTNHKIMRQIDNSSSESIISDDIYVISAKFYVTDTKNLNTDNDLKQPTVTIVITARDTSDSAGKIFTLQTTVTQRELDI